MRKKIFAIGLSGAMMWRDTPRRRQAASLRYRSKAF